MAKKFAQRLDVYLKGGQTLSINFSAEKAEVLNPQIEAFMKALGDKEKNEGSFLFQGARVVLVKARLLKPKRKIQTIRLKNNPPLRRVFSWTRYK